MIQMNNTFKKKRLKKHNEVKGEIGKHHSNMQEIKYQIDKIKNGECVEKFLHCPVASIGMQSLFGHSPKPFYLAMQSSQNVIFIQARIGFQYILSAPKIWCNISQKWS
jgi:hypothetical protein